MSFSKNYHKLIDTELFGLQILGRGMRKSDAKLETAFRDGLFNLSRVVNLKIQSHFGILQAELSQGLRQHVLGSDNNAGDIKAANNYLPQLGGLAFSGCYSLEQVIGMTIEKNAGFCKVYPPADATKK